MSNADESWLRFALQDLVEAVVEDTLVEHRTERLNGALDFAKKVLSLAEKDKDPKQ